MKASDFMHSILVVDDNQDIAMMLCEVLNSSGFEATTCYDGIEALKLITEVRPDLALIDLYLPGMNGNDIAEKLFKEFPDVKTKVIIMTGQTPGFSDLPGVDKCHAIIYKPFGFSEAISTIKSILSAE